MGHVRYSELRQNLARYMDEAIESGAPIVVTRQGGKGNVVMMAEAEFESWQETVHLLGSPRNAARLLAAIADANAGRLREEEIAEPEPDEA